MISRKKERLIWIIVVALAIAISFTGYFSYKVKADSDLYKNLRIFNQILSYIKTEYVTKEDSEKLINGAIDGMLKTLNDPYTRYMRKDAYKEMEVTTKGKFGGLGIYITIRDKQLTIISPIPDTPAYKAGLKAYDKIVKIGDKSTADMSINDAVNLMRGKVGTKVTISIMRKGLKKPVDYTLTRDIIKIKSVVGKKMDEANLGYVRIKQFGEDTATDLRDYLKKFETDKVQGVILDLRGNPGGLLIAADKVADLFLDQGLIVYTKGRIKENDMKFTASPIDYCHNLPVVILVNGGSASASEIVTGALKDNKRAVVIGEKTFGKGIVQTVKPITKNSALSFTTAKYYTPSGVCIHGIGIQPDIEVKVPELSEEEIQTIQKIFKNKYIENFVKTHPAYTKKDVEQLQTDLKDKKLPLNFKILNRLVKLEKNKDKEIIYDLEDDIQLQRAVDVLKTSKLLKRNKI